jgi:superfamily II DNA or RNA helicase
MSFTENDFLTELRSVSGLRPIYFVPRENVATEVLIPCLAGAMKIDCMIGFFSGQSFAMLAPGLASFIAASTQPLRLVICPVLSPEDREAIHAGYTSAQSVIEQFLSAGLNVEDALARHTLRCLSYLIGVGRLEIRVALLRDAIFHPKVWLISDDADTIAVHGSSNLSVSGLSRNFEQVSVTRSWIDENSALIIESLRNEFEILWSHQSDECQVYDFPNAVAKKLIREYSGSRPPSETDLLDLLQEPLAIEIAGDTRPGFRIPPHLNYTAGDFAHQGRAVDEFERHNFRGILEMATGSGKTITSMIAAHRLFVREGKLLVLISAPYLPLISQWCDEVEEFGVLPHNLSPLQNMRQRNAEFTGLARRVRMSSDRAIEVVVVTHNTICDGSFQEALAKADVPVLLIADEVHNLGREEFIRNPPENIEYRLGLSATPERQYDPDGTQGLFEYFGGTVFSFGLEQAIGVCLVPYRYYIHPLELSSLEVENWMELTEKIKKEMWKNGRAGEESPYLQILLQKRRVILESAEQKIQILPRLLDQAGKDLRYTLIYATDKDPKQLESVNELLRERHIKFHELTSQETCDRKLTARIISAFQSGDLQVLTAKRVLDEGVNIPEISTAYVLASTTVERQWTQRRGRLLRKCKQIGKQSSTVHDFFVIPPDDQVDDDTRKIVKGELSRIREFSRLSSNFGSTDGPSAIIHPIIQRFFADSGEIYATK